MCGIAGFFYFRSDDRPDPKDLRLILNSIRYRGPDHLGLFCENELAIGNVRLSIQDLSARGNQPIFSEDGNIVVVYNGEIYNYPELRKKMESRGHCFSSFTDTEVLVHLYEEYECGMADELNGMFAFALFDRKKRKLLIGRDRTGQKPLYLYWNKQGVMFCSELKAMLPFLERREINPNALKDFLSLGYVLEPETIIRDIVTLEPGTLVNISKTSQDAKKFWQPQFSNLPEICEQRHWEEEADMVLHRSLKRHILSDVPITIFLSGGVDSSLLAVYAASEYSLKHAFTGSFDDDSRHDEYDYANALGNICGIKVERVKLSRKLLANTIEMLVSDASMPVGDFSSLPTYCLARETAKHYRVVLGGDGGDELFAGYPTYKLPLLSKRFSCIPRWLIKLSSKVCRSMTNQNEYMPLSFQLQQLAMAWSLSTIQAHFEIKNFLPDEISSDIFSETFLNRNDISYRIPPIFSAIFNSCKVSDSIRRLCWVDFRTFLLSQTIPKMERLCMKFSLENRLPYLDNEMIDLSFRTDTRLMISGHKTKLCMRNLLAKKIKSGLQLNPRKQGFTPPADLLSTELKEWRDTWLSSPSPFFKPQLNELFDQWEKRKWDLHRLEWHICAFNNWCYQNRISGSINC